MLLSNYNCRYIKLTIYKIKPKIVLLHFNNNNFAVISTKHKLNVLLKFIFVVYLKFLSFHFVIWVLFYYFYFQVYNVKFHLFYDTILF